MRKSLDNFAVAVMLGLCICWGMQQVAIKLAAPSIAPVMQIVLRSAIASCLLCGFIFWRHRRLVLPANTFWPGILAGTLFAGEFCCVSIGLMYTTASHMAIFLYTAPVFTALGLHWFVAGERLRWLQFIGVLVAFSGIAIAFSPGLHMHSQAWQHILVGDALGVLAGMFWAATTVSIRRTGLSETAPTFTLLYQLVVCAILLLPVALLMPAPSLTTMTAIAWMSLLFQSIIFCFISLLVWFWMLRHYLASRLAVFSSLSPFFGVAFGVWVLHDALNQEFILGAIVVVVGVLMVNLRDKGKVAITVDQVQTVKVGS